MRFLRKQIRAEISKAKGRYKETIERDLTSSNLRNTWDGMKLLTGLSDNGMKSVNLSGFDSDKQLADSLNTFYLRLDNHDFTPQ